MGKHHRKTTLKRRIDFYMDRNAELDKITINRTVKTAMAAAALTLKTFYRFSDSKIREFIDDMDLRLEPMLNDPAVVEEVLEGLDIDVRTDSFAHAENRIRITRQDRNLCESCARCSRDNQHSYGEYYCKTKGLRFRRGRSLCNMWISHMSSWQRKIMDAGGPEEHIDL